LSAISAIVPATIVSSARVAFATATAGVAGSSPSAIARAPSSRSVFFGMYTIVVAAGSASARQSMSAGSLPSRS